MAESERRRNYRYNRVMIEASRILDPQFDDAVVFLSGAQIEMLRNVTPYLSRLDTYVTEYQPGYYLAPTTEDYDAILEIVADLEETLMGNPNVIWGYSDIWNEFVEHTMTEDASINIYSAEVPAGYVYNLEILSVRNTNTAVQTIGYVMGGGNWQPFMPLEETGANTYRIVDRLNYSLKQGDKVYVRFMSCLDNDNLELRFWGTKMVVPEE